MRGGTDAIVHARLAFRLVSHRHRPGAKLLPVDEPEINGL
jgi:hypothetical protein